MYRRLTRALARLVPLAMVPCATAQPVIDDFEVVSFQLTAANGVPGTGMFATGAPAHGIAPFREVTVLSNDMQGVASADLFAGTMVDDELVFTMDVYGGELVLRYEPTAPADLTAGGQNDRIEVAFRVSTQGFVVELRLEDSFGAASSDSVVVGTPIGGLVTFPLQPLFSPVDASSVTGIEVRVRNDTQSLYHIRHVRTMRGNASWLTFEAPVATIVGPLYPTPALVFTLADENPAGTQEIRVLDAKKVASGAATHLSLQGMDSGGDTGPGEVGAVSWSWNEPFVPWVNSSFDVQVDVNAVSGIQPQPFLPALPVLTTTSTGFLLDFDVHYQDGAGQLVMTSRRQMAFDAGIGQALSFTGVRVHPPALLRSGSTTGFRVTFDAIGGAGGVDVAEPLFECTLTGDCVPAAATGAPSVTGAAVVQALRAFPAVTRAGAELRLARPADADGRIELFDVTGRLLRRLDVPRGSTGGAWDGRAGGGVYFARFTDGRTTCVARIVKVR
jgi:hypothetical protein